MKYILIFGILFLLGCKSDKSQKTGKDSNYQKTNEQIQDSLIALFTINDQYQVDDVRRYDVYPNAIDAPHPKIDKNKINAILSIAETGIVLNFPKGFYNTAIDFLNRQNIELNFDEAIFSGAILLNGVEEKPVQNIKLKGTIITYSSFNTRFAKEVFIDTLIIKNDEKYSISKLKSSGCNIYTGTEVLDIKYLEIEGIGSNSDAFKFTPAALMIHGKNPQPYDVYILKANILSSDRHGAYLSGRFIEIDQLTINKFAQGQIDNLSPIAYTTLGDEKEYSALWLNDFDESKINFLKINLNDSPKAVHTLNLDKGNKTYMSQVLSIEVDNKKLKKIKTNPNTNVLLND